jgi:hypothetical protein
MGWRIPRRGFLLFSCSAAALAALLLVTSVAPVSFDWGRECLTLTDGGAVMAYYEVGGEWEDLAHWPGVKVRWAPAWSRGFGWPSWYWRPCKVNLTFSKWRMAYFPLYVLLPPLLVGAWLLRGRRYKAPLCRHCGYDLTGNVSGRCPECGTPVAMVAPP